MSKKDLYVARTGQRLDEMNEKMAAMAGRAAEVRSEARTSFDAEMARLRAASLQAAAKLDEVRIAGEDRWHKLVSEMERLRRDFTDSSPDFKFWR